jgi:cell division protein FtsI/penicillin-binding protein 2
VLGAVNIDGEGIEGIELYYNKLLSGTDGHETYVRDAANRKIWLIKDQCKSAVNGNSIILSIDRVVQQFTQRILGQACEYYKAESGSAIVMDPKTGDILALAVWPEVDPNNFGNTPPDVRRNRAITDPFEPGSIFKPFIASRALMMGVTHLNDSIYCHNGAYTVGHRTLHDAHGLGTLTFQEVVAKSSNIGMAILGQRLGNARLYEAVRAFGFGKKTGIDLRGEDPGIVLPYKRWTDFSTLSIPMGQEIACTSLQLVTAFAAISNNGQLLRPRLFRGAIDENGQLTDEHSEPELMNQAITPEVAQTMVREVLRLTVTGGTGKKADIPGYLVYGKTGTAQIAKSAGGGKGHYEDNAYVASFLGGAPASDPQVVVTVNIRRPDKRIGHFGGTVSAPAVKEIIKAYFDYMHIPPFEDPNKKPGEESPESPEKKIGTGDSTAE